MREIRTSGLTREEATFVPPLLYCSLWLFSSGLTTRREKRDGQRACGRERQFMQIAPLSEGRQFQPFRDVDVNRGSKDRRVIVHPQFQPSTSPRRNDLFNAWNCAWEVVGQRTDNLAPV